MNRIVPPGMITVYDPDISSQSGNCVAISIGDADPIIRKWYQGSDVVLLAAESFKQYDDVILSASANYTVLGTIV